MASPLADNLSAMKLNPANTRTQQEDVQRAKNALGQVSFGSESRMYAADGGVTRRLCFFWDYENCQFPKYNKSVVDIVSHLREKFVTRNNASEARFYCVFDASKEMRDVMDAMNHAGVAVLHVNSTSKNSADFQMISEMEVWGKNLSPNDIIVCMSGDINFTGVLRTLRYDRSLYIIVIHPSQTNQNLLTFAHESYSWEAELDCVPVAGVFKNHANSGLNNILVVENLDRSLDRNKLTEQLRKEISSIGARVGNIDYQLGTAEVLFPNPTAARRGKHRLGSLVVGKNKLRVSFHHGSELYAEEMRHGNMEIEGPGAPSATTSRGHNKILAPTQSVPGNLDLPGTSNFGYISRLPMMRQPVPQLPPRAFLPATHSAPNVRFAPPVAHPRQPFHDFGPVRQPGPRSFGINGNCFASVEFQAPRFPPYGADYFPDNQSWPVEEKDPSRDGLSPSDFLEKGESSSEGSSGSSTTFFKRNIAEKEAKAPAVPVSKKEKSFSYMQRYMLEHSSKGDAKAKAALRAAGLDSSPERPEKFRDPVEPQQAASGGGLKGEGQSKKKSNGRSQSSSPPQNQGSMKLATPSWVPVAVGDPTQIVDVYIQNLDKDANRDVLWQNLTEVLEERVPILNLALHDEEFGSAYAHVVVQQQHVEELLRFDRMSFYGRDLTVSLDDPNLPLSSVVKYSVVQVFQRAKKEKMPYIELTRLFYRDHGQDVDLRTSKKMKDLVILSEEGGNRMVELVPDWQRRLLAEGASSTLPWGYCTKHCGDVDLDKIYTKKAYRPLALIKESIGRLGDRVVTLLEKHKGSMPLNSFMVCYEEVNPRMENKEEGVYLEHLLKSIPRVEIRQNRNEPRMLVLVEQRVNTGADASLLDSANSNLEARGLLNMLIQRERASVSLLEFGDLYHSFMGHDCDLRDYDPTRMLRVVQSVSDDFEVIGVGAEQLVTLTHAAQVRRFDDELQQMRHLLNVEITADNVALSFAAALKREFKPNQYGVAFAKDLFPPLFVAKPVQAAPEKSGLFAGADLIDISM